MTSTSKHHYNSRHNFPVVATTAGWITSTTKKMENWGTSRARLRSNMINANKKGHPIHLRDIFHQPPQGCHRVQKGYKMQRRKISIVMQTIVTTIPLTLTLPLYPLMHFLVYFCNPCWPLINMKYHVLAKHASLTRLIFPTGTNLSSTVHQQNTCLVSSHCLQPWNNFPKITKGSSYLNMA